MESQMRNKATATYELLAASDTCVVAAKKLVDDAIRLRRDAYDALPMEVSLRLILTTTEPVVVHRNADGVWRGVKGEQREAAEGWILEQWERGNWIIVDY